MGRRRVGTLCHGRTRRMAAAALPALFFAALWAAWASAGPAAAAVFDPDATPSHSYTLNGSANGSDEAFDVVIGRGVTYVAGVVRTTEGGGDASLMRIMHNSWSHTTTTYDGKVHGYDDARAVALGPDGSIYTAGGTTKAGGKQDMLVVRWSKSGSVVWARRYDGPARGNDLATDIAVDRDGNVVVCGWSDGSGGSDWAVVSWTKKGTRRYAWRYNGPGKGDDVPRELLLDKKGRVYVAGLVNAPGPLAALGVARLSKAGAKQWLRTWTGPAGLGASANALTADPAGGVFVAGYGTTAATGIDALIVRYSPTGARRLVMLKSMQEDTGTDVFNDITVTTTKKVVAAGFRSAPAATPNLFWTMVAPDGATSATYQLASTADSAWTCVTRDPFGGYILAGRQGNAGTAFTTRRISTANSGAFWSYDWAPTPGAPNGAAAVAAKANLVVSVGYHFPGPGSASDQLALVWEY